MHIKTLRIVMGGCLLMSLGVLINTLALQDRRAASSQVHADKEKLNGTAVSITHHRTNLRATKLQPSVRLVRAVQRELKERKYYGGRLDGNLTLYTRVAIMDYEAEHRQPLTGEVSETLLRTILLGASLEADIIGKTRTSPQARNIISHVQMRLKKAGFVQIRVTGRLDTPTLSAIRKFEFRHKLPPKGRISYHLLLKLENIARTNANQRYAAMRNSAGD